MTRLGAAAGLLVVASACTVTSDPVSTAPTHVDAVEVPAPLGAGQVATAPELPEPRTEVTGGALDGRVVVLGGLRADGSVSPRVDAYDPASGSWERLADLPVPLHHAAATSVGDELWVLGGYADEDGRWVPQAATYRLASVAGAWVAGPPLPEPRGAAAGAFDGVRVWVVGGVGPAGLSGATWSLDPAGVDWVAGPPLREPREHLAATVATGLLYVIGGRTGGLDTNLASVERIDVESRTLEPGLPLTEARGGIAAATVKASPCVVGGERPEGTLATIECRGPLGWEVVGRLAVPRHGLAVVAVRGVLHVVAGGPEPGLTVSGVHEVVRFG